ncbi:MAG: hypothetical protein KGL17_02330 [Betaproteobacteria bacterium]|nr:hypothetical protein [Betaproteobacteria bacterium]
MSTTLPTTVLPAKQPGESVTVLFDFSSETASVTNPVCSSSLGLPAVADPTPGAMVSGAPSISPGNAAQVLQRFAGGLAGNDYDLICTAAAANGDTLICPAVLPVRAPTRSAPY